MRRRNPRINYGYRDPYNRGEQISNRRRTIQSPSDTMGMSRRPHTRRGGLQPKVRGGRRRYPQQLNNRVRRTRCCGG